MELREITAESSPFGSTRVRLQALVRYERGTPAQERYWFDVPATHADALSSTGNPWLACLLPLAARAGEPLRLSQPVDCALLTNATHLMRIWREWYPDVQVVPVEASIDERDRKPHRGAAFFSGGVDSFFTAVRDRSTAIPPERAPVNDLITVWGFDIPLARRDAFERLRTRYAEVAAALGKQFVDVITNLRETRFQEAQWSRLAHGAALASVALVLEGRYHTAYIAGSGSYRDIHPWGSHAFTDPLFSTASTAIVFDGPAFLRTDKIGLIARNPEALRHLRVCFELESDENCGRCDKCSRTMLALELYGVLAQCETFPSRALDASTVARMNLSHPFMQREMQDLRSLAHARGRADLARAIDGALVRARRRDRLRQGANVVLQPLRDTWRRIRGDA